MIQQELNELKKTLKPENNCITQIAGCYVDVEKQKRVTVNQTFLMMPEEEQFKYFELFKKGMSGKIGKNQINLEFPIAEEAEGGKQNFLYKLLQSGLKNEELLNEFYDMIINSYLYDDNYYIIAGLGTYDIPGKAKDGTVMEDASEDVYTYIDVLICPMKPSEAGLAYNEKGNTIENAIRNMMVQGPLHSFIFPAFNDRHMDIHSTLYYSKKSEKISEGLLEGVLGCKSPATAKNQNEMFIDTIENSLKKRTFDQVKDLCEALTEHEVTHDASLKGTVSLNKQEVARILEGIGAQQDEIEEFKKIFKEETENNGEILLNNIFGGNDKLDIRIGNIKIMIPVEAACLVSLKEIDGENSIVISLNENVSINGIKINEI